MGDDGEKKNDGGESGDGERSRGSSVCVCRWKGRRKRVSNSSFMNHWGDRDIKERCHLKFPCGCCFVIFLQHEAISRLGQSYLYCK